jgi:hypothetical protein
MLIQIFINVSEIFKFIFLEGKQQNSAAYIFIDFQINYLSLFLPLNPLEYIFTLSRLFGEEWWFTQRP